MLGHRTQVTGTPGSRSEGCTTACSILVGLGSLGRGAMRGVLYKASLYVDVGGPSQGWGEAPVLACPAPTLPPSQPTALTRPHPATASAVLSPTGIDSCAAGATNICGPGTCVNLPDGYRCICSPGYRLHPSQAYCTGVHAGSWGSFGGWGGWGQGWGPVQRPRQPKVQAVLCG